MNWYRKQLDKIADSCISNKASDIKNLSDILESDFQVHLSCKEAEDMLNKIASQNVTPNADLDSIISDLDLSLDSQDKSKLQKILVRYSKF